MRIRFRFAKLGKIRFTSQRDVARMWERALRRATLPLAYTEGFSPRPQLSFGLALPTGCESQAEYLDVVLDEGRPETAGVELAALPAQLSGLLPEGIDVEAAALVDRKDGSLQQQVTSCSWTMWFGGLAEDALVERMAWLMAADSVPITRERKGRQEQDDLRPSVLALALRPAGDRGPSEEAEGSARAGAPVAVVAELACQPRGVRPIELVRGLIAVAGPPAGRSVEDAPAGDGSGAGEPVLDRACRTQQWIERDGRREEPLGRRGATTGAGRAVHALERAS
jgi:radical SAM-linked protein